MCVISGTKPTGVDARLQEQQFARGAGLGAGTDLPQAPVFGNDTKPRIFGRILAMPISASSHHAARFLGVFIGPPTSRETQPLGREPENQVCFWEGPKRSRTSGQGPQGRSRRSPPGITTGQVGEPCLRSSVASSANFSRKKLRMAQRLRSR